MRNNWMAAWTKAKPTKELAFLAGTPLKPKLISIPYKSCSPRMTQVAQPTDLRIRPPLVQVPPLKSSKHAPSYFAVRNPTRDFFEGWYLRVSLPDSDESFAFMFAIEAPDRGTVQLLSSDDKLFVCELPQDGGRFFGSKERFDIGHWAYKAKCEKGKQETGPSNRQLVMQGYKLCETSCHGRFESNGQGTDAALVQWGIDYTPTLTWGSRGTSRHTATWLAQFPIFEPGYQVLMAHGVATSGYVRYGNREIKLAGSSVYCEKNWGQSFPTKWWWVQANAFEGEPELSVLALGATRQVLFWTEDIGMLSVHYKGELYEFSNWNSEVDWDVGEWGSWKASARALTGHKMTIEAHTDERAVEVLGPSKDGMIFNVRDCSRGILSVSVKDESGNSILERVQCSNAQVEVGGEWNGRWAANVKALPWLLRFFINLFNGPKVATTP